MQIVQSFVQLRRNGQGAAAFELLAQSASFSCPWGGRYEGQRARSLLTAERDFVKKGYLDQVKIEQIDENTFQRKYKFDSGLKESGNYGIKFLNRLKT